jgi:hypothetical protein
MKPVRRTFQFSDGSTEHMDALRQSASVGDTTASECGDADRNCSVPVEVKAEVQQ